VQDCCEEFMVLQKVLKGGQDCAAADRTPTIQLQPKANLSVLKGAVYLKTQQVPAAPYLDRPI